MSSDVSMVDADTPIVLGDVQDQAATLDDSAATAQSGTSQETAGLSSSSASAPRTVLGAEAPPGLLLAIEDIKPDEYYQTSDQIRSAIQNLPEQIQQHEETQIANWVHTTEQRCIAVPCGLTMSMPGRRVTAQVREFISVRLIHT